MTSAALIRTKAEETLIASFDQLARRLPGGSDDARRSALATFSQVGLPHRRIEEWKYTDLRNALKEAFAPAEAIGSAVSAKAMAGALGVLAEIDAERLVFVDGYFAPMLSTAPIARSDVVVIGPRSASVVAGQARASRGMGLDGVLALNEAFATDGAVVRVKASLPKPLMLVCLHRAEAPRRVTTRNMIDVGGGAKLDLIEVHCRLGSAPVQSSTSMAVRVGADASLRHTKVNTEGSLATHLGHTDVMVEARGNYRSFQFTAGAGLARNEMHVEFSGPDAKIDLSGVFLGRGNDHIDTTLVVDHSELGCESRELFKGVLDGRARGIFQGKVIVRPEAQKTDGKQMAKALMLSEDAEFDSKPELEIYADDVVCGHGTTAAEIDPAMLFYLRSRGIPKDEARGMLIESFVAEALDKIEDEKLRDALMDLAVGWLRANEPAKE